MTLDEECRLSYYNRIAVLNEGHGVYLVQHLESGRVFVEKVLSVYDIGVYRYLMAHPVKNTPHIYEAVEDEGFLHVIEEHISGESLEEILSRKGILSENDAMNYVQQLCMILQALHCAKPPIIHRDIKPSNVMITPDGTVKLLDMNAAKRFSSEKAEDTILIGTAGYAAPEQYGFGVSSVQTDIYALGVLLNVMLSGQTPKEQLYGGSLKPVIEKCTQLDARNRYQSVTEVLEALTLRTAYSSSPSHSFRRYLPPGFRTGQPIHMVSAGLAYFLLFVISLTLTVNNSSMADLWLNRLSLLFIGLALILLSCNYLDIWDHLRISGLDKTWKKVLAIIVLDAILFFILLIIMIILENLLLK